jgi:hypothetical protein
MVLCIILSAVCGVAAVACGAAAFWWRGQAKRYREAFDRAFAVARRAYDFTDSEKQDIARIVGPRLHGDLRARSNQHDLGSH